MITVKGGWRGTEAEQGFLREIFLGACQRFTTVLAPGSNVFHYDHIHVDLARHDPRGLKRICQPLIKFTPQLGTGVERPLSRPVPPPRQPAAPQAPVDVEEDDRLLLLVALVHPENQIPVFPGGIQQSIDGHRYDLSSFGGICSPRSAPGPW